MPKLLTWEEAKKIATRMCDEYGFPPPDISYKPSTYGSSAIEITVYRRIPNIRIFGKPFIYEEEFCNSTYGTSLENALISLDDQLKMKFAERAKKAEDLRSKFAMQEADEFLDEELRKK